MALTKRTYVDGQTIVTAANLNEIQDCIIAIEGSYVPKTRKVAGKALSSDITISAGDVGAVPTSRTINAKALSGNIILSAEDVGAVPVARTVNGKALSSNIILSAADVSAVPTTRTVNSKALSQDISLTASDIGAVPTDRTINEKALSSDITLAASDVGAVPTSRTVNSKALSSDITLAASDVGAVPTGRTVNGKALSANITLASVDIGDDSDAGGSTVKASLSSLKGAITGEQEARESAIEDITALLASIENGDTATRNYDYREFVLWKGDLYVAKTQISSGTAFSSSNLITVSDGGFNEIQSRIGNLFASYTVFNNLSDLAASINSRLTGEFIIAKISSTFSPTFFEDNTTKTSILIINKASSSNAYYLATTQDNIAIGNISLTSETVTVRKDLAAKSNSLQLNSSISYPAYLTTGLWRTGNDGTINLAFPCTSLKESTNYTTTSTVSLNIFMPGSADAATQALNKAITNVERITTDYIVLQIAAIEGIPANRIGFFSTRTAMTITAT